MVEVKDPVIVDREDEFLADEISFLNFVLSDYSNLITEEPEKQAAKEYDDQTSKKLDELSKTLKEEAARKNLIDEVPRRQYIRDKIKKY